jgi:hypothetical protein
MKGSKIPKAATRGDLLEIFSEIDEALQKKRAKQSITVIGGVSIILLGLRDRSTLDIDIANVGDAAAFRKICSGHGIQVDIVTVVSTVDFAHAPKVMVYEGKALTVDSITAEDIIKLKLERFRKQDPEDIYSIIEKISLPYERFKSIAQDMLPDFIGNPRELLLSALIVVERMYAEKQDDFKILLTKFR